MAALLKKTPSRASTPSQPWMNPAMITGNHQSGIQTSRTRAARANVERLDLNALSAEPDATGKRIEGDAVHREPSHPTIAALATMAGNGTRRKKIATNANAASTHRPAVFSARSPILITAAATMAVTAGFSP